MNSLPDGPNGTPAQRHQTDLSTLSCWSHHFPSSNSFSWNQTFLPAFLPSHVSFVPCVSRGPSVVMVQPTQAALYSDTNYLPIPLTPGGSSPILTLFSSLKTKKNARITNNRLAQEHCSWRTIVSLILSTKNTNSRIWVTWTYLTLCNGGMSAARLWLQNGILEKGYTEPLMATEAHKSAGDLLIPLVNCTNM